MLWSSPDPREEVRDGRRRPSAAVKTLAWVHRADDLRRRARLRAASPRPSSRRPNPWPGRVSPKPLEQPIEAPAADPAPVPAPPEEDRPASPDAPPAPSTHVVVSGKALILSMSPSEVGMAADL